MLQLKRIYEEPEGSDGQRILVDRLWPRGVSKDKARLDAWFKEVAPSPELRTWFGHEPARFGEFRERYLIELARNPAAQQLAQLSSGDRPITLVFAAKDTEHNHVVVLKEYLES